MQDALHTINRVVLLSWIIVTWTLAAGATPEPLSPEMPALNLAAKDEIVEGETAEGETLEGEAAEGEIVEGEQEFGREVVMPRLESRTLEEAHALIESCSLTLGKVRHECNNMLAAGVVIRQEPAFGEHVPVGTEVTLFVSTGRCLLGCDGYNSADWGTVFLGVLAGLILLTLGLFVGEEEFVNPFNFM